MIVKYGKKEIMKIKITQKVTYLEAKKIQENQPEITFAKVVQSLNSKKGKRKVQGVPQSQTVALPRPQEEEETDKSKQAQTEQTYEKH